MLFLSPLLVPSSKESRPLCSVYSARGWSEHRSQNQLRRKKSIVNSSLDYGAKQKKSPLYMPEDALLNLCGQASMLCLLSAVAKKTLNWTFKNPSSFMQWLLFTLFTCLPLSRRDAHKPKPHPAQEYLLNLTDPSIPRRMLSLLMSLWITWFEWRKSSACRHWQIKKKREGKN